MRDRLSDVIVDVLDRCECGTHEDVALRDFLLAFPEEEVLPDLGSPRPRRVRFKSVPRRTRTTRFDLDLAHLFAVLARRGVAKWKRGCWEMPGVYSRRSGIDQ